MARKVTFTLDDATLRRLQLSAERLKKPKSEIVRDAIADFHERAGKLSETERLRMLSVLDAIRSRPRSKKTAAEVDAEIAEIRRARRSGGRRSK